MRFQVPQNLDVADTIFLGLDFKQLIYLGGALGFIIALFLFAGGIIPALIFGGPVALLAGFLSFFSYNNQPFSAVLQALVRFFTKKKMYMWRQGNTSAAVQHTAHQSNADKAEEFVQPTAHAQHQKIDKVSEMSASLVFSDDEDTSYDNLDTVL